MVLPSLLTSVGTDGTSGSSTMTAKDFVPLGARDQDSLGFLLAPRPTWPCAAGTQKAYWPGSAFPLAVSSTVTLSAAAAATPGSSNPVAAAATARHLLSSDIPSLLVSFARHLTPAARRKGNRALRPLPGANAGVAHWPSGRDLFMLGTRERSRYSRG